MASSIYQHWMLVWFLFANSFQLFFAEGSSAFFHLGARDPIVNASAFRKEVSEAAKSVLGCGGQVERKRLLTTRNYLFTMWHALPKNSHYQVERRALRYLGHRYFMRRYGISIRGLEPPLAGNQASQGTADILSQQVPGYVEAVLESQHATVHGFSIDDATLMVVMLEQLISDSQIGLLEHVYAELNLQTSGILDDGQIRDLIELYVVHLVVGDGIDNKSSALNLFHQTDIRNAYLPYWTEIHLFVDGEIWRFDYAKQRGLASGRSKEMWQPRQYSFEDAHSIVSLITNSFASIVNEWCQVHKEVLQIMDPHGLGRVPLSKLNSPKVQRRGENFDPRATFRDVKLVKGSSSRWQELWAAAVLNFNESEEVLQELGALDVSSKLFGKQVIIPNYIQSSANCHVQTSHYAVCCTGECESILDEIEYGLTLHFPFAESSHTPNAILEVVRNLTLQASLDDDDPVHVGDDLEDLLQQIAALHGGEVYLHGRLFAQWLHYLFPRECPFPHQPKEAESTATSRFLKHTPRQEDDLLTEAALEALENASKEELDWMSQWDWHEELFIESLRVLQVEAKYSWGRVPVFFAALVILVAAVYVGIFRWKTGTAFSDSTVRHAV